MKLEFHPDASKHFDEVANSLVIGVKPDSQIITPESGNSFKSERYISSTISEKDIIGEIETRISNGYGQEVGRYLSHEGQDLGLEGDDYIKFLKLAESIQRTNSFCEVISESTIRRYLFRWIIEKYKGTTNELMSNYIISKCKAEINEFEVWIPIAMLCVQSDIPFGNITIKPITKNQIDIWQQEFSNISKDKKEQTILLFEQLRKEIQGFAAGVFMLSAEIERAKELAFEETEKSIALLRFFSPASMSPYFNCYCTIKGFEGIGIVTHIILKDGKISFLRRSISTLDTKEWKLINNEINFLRNTGLDLLSELIRDKKRTQFREKILDCLLLFSKVSTSHDLSEKLIYLFSSLEGILLKNDSESIQQNLGERMATLLGKNLDEKKKIVKNVKDVYSVRTKFIHHAHQVDDMEMLSSFMWNVWNTFIIVINNSNKFQTKDQFITAIDDEKLSPRN